MKALGPKVQDACVRGSVEPCSQLMSDQDEYAFQTKMDK